MEPQRTSPDAEQDLESLAADFLARSEAGEEPSETEYIRGLGDDEREEFLLMIRAAQGVKARLPHRIRAGDVLGRRYRIERALDEGGMGQVFVATDLELEREVALKVLLPEAAGNTAREELLQDESKMLAALKHPGIVAVHDVGWDRGALFVAMDLVQGRDLHTVLSEVRSKLKGSSADGAAHPVRGDLLAEAIGRERPAGLPDLIDESSWYRSAATLMVEIARTVEAAHGSGLVHRDLKPKNIMLQGGGSPVVLDFGLAGRSEVKVGRVTQGFYGSVPYVSPEQARTYRVGSDPRSDVYQLGLVLYELLTLQRAFPGSVLPAILVRVKEGRFERPRAANPNAPIELEAVCLKAMELSPERRYQSAQELREDLERWRAGLPPLALKGHRLRRAARTTRFVVRRRAIWLAAAAALVAVLLGQWAVRADRRWEVNPAFFRYEVGQEQWHRIDMRDSVAPDQLIGIEVDSSHPVTLYAFSIVETEDGREYMLPTPPATLAQLQSEEELDQDALGLDIPSGRTAAFCTRVEDRGQDSEELLVFASLDRNPALETWVTQLRDLQSGSGALGVPYADAMRLLDNLSGNTRGGALAGIPKQERERMLAGLSPDALKGNQSLGNPGLRRFYVRCSVLRE